MSTVSVELANLAQAPGVRARLEAQWLGEPRSVVLLDNGSVPGDVPADQVYVGRLEGDPVRLLPVRLLVSAEGSPEREVYAAVEAVDGGDATWVYVLEERGGNLVAERVAAPHLGQPRPWTGNERVLINGVWIALVLGVVAWLVRSRR